MPTIRSFDSMLDTLLSAEIGAQSATEVAVSLLRLQVGCTPTG